MSSRTRSFERGFTLIETMVTLGVFSIGMLGVVAYQTKTANSTAMAQNLAVSTYIANALADDLAIVPPALLVTGTRTATFDNTGTALSNNANAQVGTTFHVTTQVGAADAMKMRDVNVVIQWQNPGAPSTTTTRLSTKVQGT